MAQNEGCQVQIANMMAPLGAHIQSTLQPEGQPWLLSMRDSVHVDAWLSHPAEVLVHRRLATPTISGIQDPIASSSTAQTAEDELLPRDRDLLMQRMMSQSSCHTEVPMNSATSTRSMKQPASQHLGADRVLQGTAQPHQADCIQGAHAEHGGVQSAGGSFSLDSLREARQQLEAMCMSDDSDASPAILSGEVDVGSTPCADREAPNSIPRTGTDRLFDDLPAGEDAACGTQQPLLAESPHARPSASDADEELASTGFHKPRIQNEDLPTFELEAGAEAPDVGSAQTAGAVHFCPSLSPNGAVPTCSFWVSYKGSSLARGIVQA
jgi:hypothetical protein